MAKVVTIPARPNPNRIKKPRSSDPRYIEGQGVIVGAIKYLTHQDLQGNRDAIELLSDHFRNKFRMDDSPLRPGPGTTDQV
jgi:hypothetical protein